ncbi:unnamed protein product [Fraxinus pennsylvanica]|uniref:RNase H type-1 domain-containing protein n=1 Tax=Fraxinus pennsylvanica TaxID=56036 RepID=A0AAD2DHT3_9LAMI|nr:unnamed protein product [Fraxinus pennsylvanica]
MKVRGSNEQRKWAESARKEETSSKQGKRTEAGEKQQARKEEGSDKEKARKKHQEKRRDISGKWITHQVNKGSILVLHTIAWTTPVEDAWKLNFAAYAPNQHRHAGAGYVLREHHGIFKAARAEPLPNDFSHIEAKLVALDLGLQEAIVQGIDYLEIEGHSPYAMEMVVDDEATLTPSIRSIVHKCRTLLQQFKLVKFHPVAAYANRAATKVAEMATKEAETQRWTMEPPDEIAKILVEDMTGFWESLYY